MTEFDRSHTSERVERARQFIEALPHNRALGLKLVEIGAGFARLRIPYDQRLIGDPETGVLHGGVVTALLDSCCGTAVMTHPTHAEGTATIDLRIDYMRGSRPGADLYAHAVCHRATRNVAFVRATAYETDEDDPVATATGAFTIERGR